MDLRPYPLVGDSALSAIRDAAQARCDAWCADWGVDPAALRVEAARQDAAASQADAAAALHIADGFDGAVHRLVTGVALPQPRDGIAAQCAAQAAGQLRLALAALAPVPAGPRRGAAVRVQIVSDGPPIAHLVVDASAYTPPRAVLAALDARQLDAGLRSVPVTLELVLGDTELSLQDLLELKPDDVLLLDRRIHETLSLRSLTDATSLPAHLGRLGTHFAAQLVHPAST